MDSKQKYNCIFCKESFEEKDELQIHFRKHGDPKFNQSVKNNKSRVPNESQTSVEGPNEEGEMVSCDVCSDVFPTISKAITHKHKVHPDHDAKYFCPWCGKLFTMKHLYNKHIQTNHDSVEASGDTGFHCDYCEVDFFIPSAMVYHNKFFHRQDTELAAIGHSKKLKLFNQELLQIFYCPFCGEEYFNKVNLHKHMGDDHIDEDQSPDDVLRCPLCEAIFYHLDAYELHLTFHSSEDIYSEENERASDVAEFSLETVPPIMEKVENDTQEDAESTMNSLGIEELLQQAMNETNDASNSECVPGKKSKKHKKHKKSKKPAITLDEFLNMNKDVFGEGIDFHGIEEVPEQVVAKQLKGKRVPKPKTATKMLSQDLAKLKKIGIVVKKKSGKSSNQVSGMINKERLKGTPVKVAQNLLKNKTPVTQTTAISTSGEVLTRLLNQSNSQIKIVKKSLQDNSLDFQKPSEDFSKETQGNQDDSSDKKIEDAVTDNSIRENDNISEKDSEEHANSMKPKCSYLDDKQKVSQETLTSILDNQKTNSKFTNENSCTSKSVTNKNENENSNCDTVTNSTECHDGDENLKEDSKLGTAKTNVTNTLNALRNISQHLTIKSLSSPNNVQSQQTTSSNSYVGDHLASDINDDEHNETTGEKSHDTKSIKDQHEKNNTVDAPSSHRMMIKPVNQTENSTTAIPLPYITENKTDTQEVPQNEEDINDDEHNEAVRKKNHDGKSFKDQKENNSNKNSLNALKHLSHLITVKPVNQSKNITTAIALPYITDNKTCNQEVQQNKEDINDDDETFQEHNSEDVKSTRNENSNKNSLNAIKHLSHLIKVKPVKESKNSTTSIALPYITKNKTVTQEVSQNEDDQENYHQENREVPKATIEDINIVKEQLQLKKEISPLDAFKNISKNITIKSLTHQTENVIDHSSGESKEDMHDDEDVDIGVESNKPETNNFIENKTNLKCQPTVTKSVNDLKTPENRNQPISPKTIKRSTPGNEIQTSNKEFKLGDDTTMNKSCTNILKHLPNLTAKQVTVPKTIIQKVTVQSSTQSMNFLKDNIVQQSVKKEINKDIEIFNIDDSDDEEANSQDSSINQPDSKPMIETTKNTDKNYIDKSKALKNLSKHITIKTSNQQKPLVNENINSSEDMQDDVDCDANSHDSDNENDSINNPLKHNIEKPRAPKHMMETAKNTPRNVGKTNVNKSVDVLKNLSRHITIKSANQQKTQINENLPSPENMLDDHEADSNDYNNGDNDVNNILKQGIKKQTEQPIKMASLINTYKSKDALKNISKNITVKSSNQQKLQINKTMCSSEDLQDFIDYEPHSNSDDEADVTKNILKPIVQKPSNNTPKNVQKTDINRDALKNLSKHITIKSSNQQNLSINKNVPSPEHILDNIDYDVHLHDSDNEPSDVPKNALKHVIKKQQERRNVVIKQGEQRNVVIKKQEEQRNVVIKKQGDQKNVVLQQTLKTLSKNISMKSNNSSPKMPKSQSTNDYKHNVLLDGFDSDSNSNPGNVKITEMSDDNISDDEFLSQIKDSKNSQTNRNVIVQSPNESNSDNDDNHKQPSEIESRIKLNTVKSSPQSSYMDSLKNISKQITIKSRKDNNLGENNETEAVSTKQKDLPAVPHLSKEMSIKPFRQSKPDCRDDSDAYTNRTINRSSTNLKGFTSSNSVNTVNKEVTVKTFQSQTVIEEVTTTVTKTFRTINQTVKQEVRNMSQSSSAMHVTRPQIIQGIRPNQQIKNVHAIPVRQSTPTMGPRIRNTLNPTRPALVARTVRPSNQLVPTRPNLNIPRPSNPRMPVARKIQTPPISTQKPITGKPLKISPNAMMPSIKRPLEDSTGHFSCFKKPKESLIPVADVPVFSSKQDSGTAVHYASSSNNSRSNFTSTTKIVKGNSVVTSTQAKSEVRSNSEQLSKLGNMSGIKIMKTSQTKQACQVEEKCEISASKRIALEAIDKLQKSGLLVKKPRIEDDRFSEHSNSDFDDNLET